MNKLSIFKIVGLIILSTNINASEFSYLYKDQRIMAAGGANVASGGYSSSIFSNPAGIAKVSNRNGVLYELIGTQVSVSGQTI